MAENVTFRNEGRIRNESRMGIQTVRLAGRVDVRTVGDLRLRLHTAIDGGAGQLHVNVSGLELVDHAGLGVLLGGARRAQRLGRCMVLVEVPPALGKLLAANRLGRIFRVEDADLLHMGHA